MGKRIEYAAGDLIPGTRLTFLRDLPSLNKRRQARFECSCGTVVERDLNWVRFLTIRSCGCYKTEQLVEKNTTHSQASRGKPSGAYRSWKAMHQRVKSNPHYTQVSICTRWYSFEDFYADMGDRPKNHTIERKNNLGDYEPGNCIWATLLTQAQNTSQTTKVTIDGETRSIQAWCRIKGIGYHVIKQRRHRGMTLEDAITTPINTSKQGRKKHG